MKTLVVLMMTLFTVSAFAKNFDSMTPRQIDRMAKYELDRKDKIWFNQAQFGLHGVNSWSKSLCTDGTFIYGGTTTVKHCQGDDNSNCKETVVDLVQPINGKRYQIICSGSDNDENCVKNKVNFVQPVKRSIPVLLQQNGGDDNKQEVVAGYKAYTIPSCDLTPVPAW